MENKIRKIVRDILKEFITHRDLKDVERYADDIFSDIGVDVEFTKHFHDRVNDPRNKKDIDTDELKSAFKKSRLKHGKTIKDMGDQEEAVINDTETDINIPFVISKDNKGDEEMINKTIMRKKNFLTYTPKLKLEIRKIMEDINIPINVGDEILGGKFKNKKVKVKEIGKNDKGDITINGKPLLRFRIIKKEK